MKRDDMKEIVEPLPLTTGEKLHIRDATSVPGVKCEIHWWPTKGLPRRLIEAMRARHKTGGINACSTCIERARVEAKKNAGQ